MQRIRTSAIGILVTGLLANPALSQSVEESWQTAIDRQITAFRAADGATALEMAAEGFKSQFDDPELFFTAIIDSGYEPIVTSRSHSFGNFRQVGDTVAVQVVNIVGPDQLLYSAVYQMVLEDNGWRVQGVALRREAGFGV